MIKYKYPNYECGECPAWLAYEGDDVSFEEVIKYCEKKHCPIFLEGQYECDGRCHNCDHFDGHLGECGGDK